jgi:ATP-dependent exoDNAse (exonuclease V) beta subunit
MNPESIPFRIYDASAGSGKTFTLAREYLRLLLHPGADQEFRRILAITFTNKAVAELKQRILKNLMEFSSLQEGQQPPDLFLAVQEGLEADRDDLVRRSRKVLGELLHNYAFFDVSTIDRFNHRILRTFAQDLELPSNFEVVLDTDALLARAVDALVQKAGSHPALTAVLIEFALEKAEEDRSWDISRDLLEMGQLLFDENHYPYLEDFRGKAMEDFQNLRELLGASRRQTEALLVSAAREAKELTEAHGLERPDFSSGYFPDFLEKVAQGDFDQNFEAGWKQNFGQQPLYPKKADPAKKAVLDDLLPVLTGYFEGIRDGIQKRDFLVNAYANCAPFTVLGMLKKELDLLRDEGGYLPISSFNAIIAGELKDQPAPYLYERLGERYRHYFIDEFQDTSGLQWENLIPLIGSVLQGEDEQGRRGSLVLVGDAKQAIYRWRGGKAEQFLRLAEGNENPFSVPAQLEALPQNFRSQKPLVAFNNAFFSHISAYMGEGSYADLFRKGNRQVSHRDGQGLVQIDLVPADAPDAAKEYLDRTLALVKELKDKGYPYRELCILTRRRKEGVMLSGHLMEAGIPVISSETLLLKNHPEIRFLIDLLHHLAAPEDRNHAFGLLMFLSEGQADRHQWIARHLSRADQLLEREYGFAPGAARLKPVYDLLEEAIRQFRLGGENDAYLVFLMDLVLEVGRSEDSSIQAFLDYWEAHQDKLSIQAPEGFNAVTLMTIHKSKGLEFPIVIYPFADTPIYREKNPRLWFPVAPEHFAGFRHVLLSRKKEMKTYAPPAPALYEEERHRLELDAYNLLYVAHTRAIRALFVISRESPEKDVASGPQSYGEVYCRYLRENGLWEDGRFTYSFGDLPNGGEPAAPSPRENVRFRYTARDRTSLRMVTRSGILWDTDQARAIRYGNILHYALSQIHCQADIGPAMGRLQSEGLLPHEDREAFGELLLQVVGHPRLQPYFAPGSKGLNEWELLTKNGLILRPDRLVLLEGGVAILDYKTGAPRPEYHRQVGQYADTLREMGHAVEAAILVYIDKNQITPEFI